MKKMFFLVAFLMAFCFTVAKNQVPFPEFTKEMLPKELGCSAECWGATCSASGIKCVCGCTYLGLSCTCSAVLLTNNKNLPVVKFTHQQYDNMKSLAEFFFNSSDQDFKKLYTALYNMVKASGTNDKNLFAKNFDTFKTVVDALAPAQKETLNAFLISKNAPTL